MQSTKDTIVALRVFSEPLIFNEAASLKTGEAEALLATLQDYIQKANPEDFSGIELFLKNYPESGWRLSLLTNMGLAERRTGYLKKALGHWEQAWLEGKQLSSPKIKALMDRNVAELAELNARLGQYDRLEALFSELEGRDLQGPASEKIAISKEGLWKMNAEPGAAFWCGPAALSNLWRVTKNTEIPKLITETKSTRLGTNLAQMETLSKKTGLDLKMAKRSVGAEVVTPALLHWKAGHFAALTRSVEEQGQKKYLVEDPTFGDDMWVSQKALDEEASGYMLVASNQALPQGWSAVEASEGQSIWGRGATTTNTPIAAGPGAPIGGGCQSGGGMPAPSAPSGEGATSCTTNKGMAGYSVHSMLLSLHLTDTPVGYETVVGPDVNFTLEYNQRDAYQPANFSYGNMGSKWMSQWMAYVEDDPANSQADIKYYQGWGYELYEYDAQTQAYSRAMKSQAQIERVAAGVYKRSKPDGSYEEYAQADGSLVGPRKVFLTKVADAQGNAVTLSYDAKLRLVTLTDALGQVTTLDYELVSDPLKITKITDPFGRFATLEYDASGRLKKITDVVGITSEFEYDGDDFITKLTTPYGETLFEKGEVAPPAPLNKAFRWIEVTDPKGAKERFEFRHLAPGVLVNDPVSQQPSTGFANPKKMNLPLYTNMNYRNTFYWNKAAYEKAKPSLGQSDFDYMKATIYHWLHGDKAKGEEYLTVGVLESLKKPLENRIWYQYPGQTHSSYLTGVTLPKPVQIGRKLDDGTSQIYDYEYNALGKITRFIDPAGRETKYEYDASGMDLQKVWQKNGANWDLLATYVYNAQHQPIEITDAALEKTELSYNAQGQLETVTNALGQVTTLQYNANHYLTDVFVSGVNGPVLHVDYDNMGRVLQLIDTNGESGVRSYDALDRLTQVVYPDGTSSQITYDKLDVATIQDRLGQVTTYQRDALRQLSKVIDPSGREKQYQWSTLSGTLDRIVDGEGGFVQYLRDGQNRLVAKGYGDNQWDFFAYEEATSRVKTKTDDLGRKTHYNYFIDNKIKSKSYSNEQAFPYPGGMAIQYSYDPYYPRLTQTVEPLSIAGTTSYFYHQAGVPGAGQLSLIAGQFYDDDIYLFYDTLGRLQKWFVVADGLVPQEFGEEAIYDNLGRLETLQNDVLGSFQLNYDGNSQRVKQVSSGNQVTEFTYENALGDYALKQILHFSGNQALAQYNFVQDDLGRIQNLTESDLWGNSQVQIGYDPASQILAYTSGSSTWTYQYDQAGNRVQTSQSFSGFPSGSRTYHYNNLNQLIAYEDSPAPLGQGWHAVQYDATGNVISDGAKSYVWDTENRLRLITNGNQESEFRYDAFGRLRNVQERLNGAVVSDRQYLWLQNRMVQESRASSAATHQVTKRFYTQGEQQLNLGTGQYENFYYKRDRLGSVRQLVSDTGAVVAAYDYSPWGEVTKVTGNSADASFAYAGYFVHKPSGLNLAHYRAYDPNLGRWLSRDPALDAEKLAEGPNLYAYVGNNPMNMFDPSGLALQPGAGGSWGGIGIFGTTTAQPLPTYNLQPLPGYGILVAGIIGVIVWAVSDTDADAETDCPPSGPPIDDMSDDEYCNWLAFQFEMLAYGSMGNELSPEAYDNMIEYILNEYNKHCDENEFLQRRAKAKWSGKYKPWLPAVKK